MSGPLNLSYARATQEEVESFLESIERYEEEEEEDKDLKPAVTKRKAPGNADSEPQAKVQKKVPPSSGSPRAPCFSAFVLCTAHHWQLAGPCTAVSKRPSQFNRLGSKSEKACLMLRHGLQQNAASILRHECPWQPAEKAAAGKDQLVAEDEEEEEEEGDDAGGSDGLPIKLSSNRRADVSDFKGKTLVNIREYYEVTLTSPAVKAFCVCLSCTKPLSVQHLLSLPPRCLPETPSSV